MPLPAPSADFRWIHHRALNDQAHLKEGREAAARLPNLKHFFESDVCWAADGAKRIFYFRHPDRLTDEWSAKRVLDARKAGELIFLEDLAGFTDQNERYVLEIKIGPGSPFDAMDDLYDQLRATNLPDDRFVIDGYSRRLLMHLHARDAMLPLTMHMEDMFADRAWVTAPRTDFTIRRLEPLRWLTAINLRWWGSEARLRRRAATIARKGLAFQLSRLNDAQRLQTAIEVGAAGGYAKSDLILEYAAAMG
ncbi:MAG: hypothetical protein AB7J28_12190 [Hyphomonadaceae bacterium]